MVCECGGMLLVISVEDYPEQLSNKERLTYNRLCDVECQTCGTIYYSQPYDEGSRLNLVRGTKQQ
ncbi:hypothetical protein GLW20_08560 [Virgibacillus halodenitrificans]|nr:hypothetical protein [Virgibacillus halodenitrificans]